MDDLETFVWADMFNLIRAADEMARVADDWIERGLITSRSALAGARLQYGEPFEYKAEEIKNELKGLTGVKRNEYL